MIIKDVIFSVLLCVCVCVRYDTCIYETEFKNCRVATHLLPPTPPVDTSPAVRSGPQSHSRCHAHGRKRRIIVRSAIYTMDDNTKPCDSLSGPEIASDCRPAASRRFTSYRVVLFRRR